MFTPHHINTLLQKQIISLFLNLFPLFAHCQSFQFSTQPTPDLRYRPYFPYFCFLSYLLQHTNNLNSQRQKQPPKAQSHPIYFLIFFCLCLFDSPTCLRHPSIFAEPSADQSLLQAQNTQRPFISSCFSSQPPSHSQWPWDEADTTPQLLPRRAAVVTTDRAVVGTTEPPSSKVAVDTTGSRLPKVVADTTESFPMRLSSLTRQHPIDGAVFHRPSPFIRRVTYDLRDPGLDHHPLFRHCPSS
ncbi:hypothetical protein CLAIMM_10320 isoform 4 [Cladophialophora immunda]|nr:hypothetical protein CLAIMM_10320 isoform 1 [Cladophialophora immunda]OQV05605.1 hypothetical protein CLAIMM_10320 isoform 2 [Cladophialophora immunda]OQV05606.1 hypothetical protein CLAIMM_10320 isoform 3 [Cladophialophora immunda]OQV05607.1 hypothetical protein CLAIMM_10320 isoform 4 [Cladophialophora immunda]